MCFAVLDLLVHKECCLSAVLLSTILTFEVNACSSISGFIIIDCYSSSFNAKINETDLQLSDEVTRVTHLEVKFLISVEVVLLIV